MTAVAVAFSGLEGPVRTSGWARTCSATRAAVAGSAHTIVSWAITWATRRREVPGGQPVADGGDPAAMGDGVDQQALERRGAG